MRRKPRLKRADAALTPGSGGDGSQVNSDRSDRAARSDRACRCEHGIGLNRDCGQRAPQIAPQPANATQAGKPTTELPASPSLPPAPKTAGALPTAPNPLRRATARRPRDKPAPRPLHHSDRSQSCEHVKQRPAGQRSAAQQAAAGSNAPQSAIDGSDSVDNSQSPAKPHDNPNDAGNTRLSRMLPIRRFRPWRWRWRNPRPSRRNTPRSLPRPPRPAVAWRLPRPIRANGTDGSTAASATTESTPNNLTAGLSAGLSTGNATGVSNSATSGATSGTGPADVDRVRFVQRVARAFQGVSAQGGSLRLRLSPPELGSVKLDVTVRGGVLNARAAGCDPRGPQSAARQPAGSEAASCRAQHPN